MLKIDRALLEKTIQDHTIITGGHFMILENGTPNLNEGTIESFRLAVEACAWGKSKGFKVQLGILINNMGGVCDAKKQVCAINPEKTRESFALPEVYQHILVEYSLDDVGIEIFWEKSLRNRGKKELLKKIKEGNSHVALAEGAYWFINPDDGRRITLSRPNKNDKYGIAACPLIMASFAQQMKTVGYSRSVNFYYVDLDNEENIPNYFAIEKGRTVATHFYPEVTIVNFYLLKDKVVTSFDLETL